MSTGLRKIVHLQALRALAASCVVLSHALEYLVRRKAFGEDGYSFAWCLGWIGVATFFVISGLIMIRSSSTNFGSGGYARRFALRRVIRVVPLYWLATIPFAAAALARGENLTWSHVAKSLFFIPYAAPGANVMRPIVGQGWTLNYEMLFYATFTFCLLVPRRLGISLLLFVFPILVVIGLSVRPLIPYTDPVLPLQFWTDPIMLLFSLGVIIGLVETRGATWHSVSFPIMWAMVIIAAEIALFHATGGSFPLPLWWQGVFAAGAALTVILCTSMRGHRFPALGRIFEAAGDASYSTYLFHPIVLMVLTALWDRLPDSLKDPGTFLVVALLACNVVGYASFRLLERPLTAGLRARFDPDRRPSVSMTQHSATLPHIP